MRSHCRVSRLSALAAGLVTTLTASAVAAEQAPGDTVAMMLSSGMQLRLAEIIWDDEARIGRFRFIAPALAEITEREAAIDAAMEGLCNDFAKPVQRGLRPGWDAVVISLAEAPVPFGEYDPSVLQIFSGFTIVGADCRWDEF